MYSHDFAYIYNKSPVNTFKIKRFKPLSFIYGRVVITISLLALFFFVAFGIIFRSVNERHLNKVCKQSGSNITKERLRFDFTFDRKLTPEEVEQVEHLVNGIIDQDVEVEHSFMQYDDAIAQGAIAFFKDTYGDEVSVYRVGNFSMELCGGPHVERTGVLGRFRITKQKKIGAGLMRIRGVLEPREAQ